MMFVIATWLRCRLIGTIGHQHRTVRQATRGAARAARIEPVSVHDPWPLIDLRRAHGQAIALAAGNEQQNGALH